MSQNLLIAIVMNVLSSITCFAQTNTSAIYSYKNSHHPVVAEHGMVASQEAIATTVGVDILKKGGNAIDAAVAVGFALAVTLPQAGNLGGGGFMMIYVASENRSIALDFRESAPLLAEKDMFLDNDGHVDANRSRFSLAASGVPGSVHGLITALKKHGSLPLSNVINPAIQLAENGIVVSPALHQSLSMAQSRLLRESSPSRDDVAGIFYPSKPNQTNQKNQAPKSDDLVGMPLPIGSRLIQSNLAKTLRLILENGASGFYNGPTAKKIITFMNQNNGLITMNDLVNYQSIERTPITTDYKGYQVVSMPPPSSGGIALAQLLKLMAPYPIDTWGHNSARTIHHSVEAMNLVYADRAEWLGDMDVVDVPMNQLISDSYIENRRQDIHPTRHTYSRLIAHGNPVESDETTHYSVVDQWGNAVSVTTTLNFSYGSGIMVPGTGFFLNNEMDDFSAKPGVPNAYGLIGNARNAIAPNKRMLSSMTPIIIHKDNKVFMVSGSPGGSRIITTVAQLIFNVVDHGMTVAEATHAPRFHSQWHPDEIRIESHGFSVDTLNILRQYGHRIVSGNAMGSTQSILRVERTWQGASDPRKPGALTLGY